MIRVFLILLAVLATLPQPALPEEETSPPEVKRFSAKEIGRLAFPGVVLLKMHDAHGNSTSVGSGFFVGDGLVATNLHVVGASVGGQAFVVGKKDAMRITAIERVDTAQDLALLRVSPSFGSVLNLGASDLPEAGEDIYVIGNPQGFEGTLSHGIVSGLRDLNGMQVIQMTAPISQGSSGGPVLDSSGRVIGIAVALWAEGQNINFAVPVRHLTEMLKFKR